VGIIAQPDWQSAEPFKALGKPNLFFGVTAGNMDSMINRYTADRKIRSDDAYTPAAWAGKRPDRAALVYAQRCREAYKDVPIIMGGIEGSLRRIAHYDYWQDKVRRSASWWTPNATCCCTATPSAPSSKSPTAWRRVSPLSKSPMCAAPPSFAPQRRPDGRAIGLRSTPPTWTPRARRQRTSTLTS
jgi:hypothetical protein